MERADAERVFAVIADLKGDLRDRQVTERWWLVWIACAVQILPTNLITQWLIWRGEATGSLDLWPFVLLWGTQVLLLPVTIKLIHRHRGGQRSQRETFIWGIWLTFLAAASLWALVNGLLGLPLFQTAPAVPLLAAVAWATMAMTVHPAFLGGAAVFVGATLGMALVPSHQFVLYGVCWFAVLMGLGLYFRPRPHRGEAL